jgi:hypothetical protein
MYVTGCVEGNRGRRYITGNAQHPNTRLKYAPKSFQIADYTTTFMRPSSLRDLLLIIKRKRDILISGKDSTLNTP